MELTIVDDSYRDIKNFSLLSKNLTSLKLKVNWRNLSNIIEEIMRLKETLQILWLDINFIRSKLSDLSKFAALRMCSSLKILQIKVAVLNPEGDYSPAEGDVFMADIIKSCTNLEFVHFASVSLNDETMKQLFSLQNFKQLFLTEHENNAIQREYFDCNAMHTMDPMSIVRPLNYEL